MKKIYSVEEYIEENSHFSEALILLRNIINTTELEETVKWSAPVYTLNSKKPPLKTEALNFRLAPKGHHSIGNQ